MANKFWIDSGAYYCELCAPHIERGLYDVVVDPPPYHDFCNCVVKEVAPEDERDVVQLIWERAEARRQRGGKYSWEQSMDIVRSAYNVESHALDVDAGIYQAMIMTDGVMRSGDSIEVAGGLLDGYMKNPIVPWSHNYHEPPVGKCLSLEKQEHGIAARFQFAPVGMSARADEIHGLWRGGFLNAVSIGILPLEWVELKGDDWFPPRRFMKWEMVEFSIVSIPNNADALRMELQSRANRQSERLFLESVSNYLSVVKEYLS